MDSDDVAVSVQHRVISFQDAYQELTARLSSSSSLILASDIGGEHPGSNHLVITFALIAHDSALGGWRQECERVRRCFLPDRRRMSFKGLNDGRKRRALVPFLSACDQLNGVLVSVVIEKRIGALFQRGVVADLSEAVQVSLAGWKASAVEQGVRLSHFASILLAQFSSPSQHALWIADDDMAFANDDRLKQFCNLFDEVLAGYPNHDLGPVMFGTPGRIPLAGNTGEDLVALADFAAGTVSDWIPSAVNSGLLGANQISMLPVVYDKVKMNLLMKWYAGDAKPLKRLTIVVSAAPSNRFRVTSIAFLGEAREGVG